MEPKLDEGKKKKLIGKGFHWSKGLLKAMEDPKLIILEDELTVAINDLYPKAIHHYLVCPKEDIPSLKSIQAEHLSLLQHMHKVATRLCDKHKEYEFLIGYHSVPSMDRLHLHVISTDFDSTHLKTKKHWNSFTTEFFRPSQQVIKELKENGKISHIGISESKHFIEKSLKCHKCDYKPKHMPDLKHHLKSHVNL